MSLVLKKLENLSRTENSVPFLNFPLFGRIAENELFLPQERPSSPLSTFYSAFYLFVTSRHNPFPDALHLVLSCIICSRGDLCIHPNFERICALAAVLDRGQTALWNSFAARAHFSARIYLRAISLDSEKGKKGTKYASHILYEIASSKRDDW